MGNDTNRKADEQKEAKGTKNDRVAIIRMEWKGKAHEWAVGAAASDNEDTIRAHLAKWMPEARFTGVSFDPA